MNNEAESNQPENYVYSCETSGSTISAPHLSMHTLD